MKLYHRKPRAGIVKPGLYVRLGQTHVRLFPRKQIPAGVVRSPYYECHITLKPHPDLECNIPLPWRFSQIDGDPVLGKKVLAYATRYYSGANTLEEVVADMEEVAHILVSGYGFAVLRQKVELILFDLRKEKVL